MFPEQYEQYEEDQKVKAFKKQNGGRDDHEARNPVAREFKELRGMKDFENICVSHKACALALLPAITSIDYEAENHNQKLALLQQMDEAAGKDSSPVHYTWVNATCHGEVFEYFDVEPTALPTILYLHQQHNKYGVMIGKFDAESI